MIPRSPDLDELILTIHSAALSADGWNRISHDLRRALSAQGAAFVRPSGGPSFKAWCRLFEFDPLFMKEYVDQWAPYDVWYRGAVTTGRLGVVGLVSVDSQLIEYRDYKTTMFYNEYLRRMNIDRMMTVMVAGPERDGSYGATAMSFYRGPSREPFSPGDAGLLTRLAPHLSVAINNYFNAQSLLLREAAYHSAIDTVSSGVFGVQGSLRVCFTNRAADDMVRHGRWMQIRNGALTTANHLIEAAHVAAALHRLGQGLGFQLLMTDGLSGAQAVVSGAPIPLSEVNDHAARVTALVWLTPVTPQGDVAAALGELFGLTSAEQRLVGRLVSGDDLRLAAESLHISLHTARTQLKSIFSKSRLRTQAALLAFAARLSALRREPS